MSDPGLDLPPELAAVEALLAPASQTATLAALPASAVAATARAGAPARDLATLVACHADEAQSFLEALLGDAAVARDVLEETLARASSRLVSGAALDLHDLLGLARAHGVAARRLLDKGRPSTGRAVGPLPPDVRALLILRHGLGLTPPALARAGIEAPRAALEAAAEQLVACAPGPGGLEGAEALRLLARDVAGLASPAERARLEALAASAPAIALVVARVKEALGVPLAAAPPELLARVEERLGIEAEREASLARVALRVTLRCTYCHDGLSRDDAAHCGSCLAPHHADCFATHGRCGAPGCAGDRVVRAEPASAPAAAGPRRRWWIATGLVGLVAAAAALSDMGPDGGRVTSIEELRASSASDLRQAKKAVLEAEAALADSVARRTRGRATQAEVEALRSLVAQAHNALALAEANARATERTDAQLALQMALLSRASGDGTDAQVDAARAALDALDRAHVEAIAAARDGAPQEKLEGPLAAARLEVERARADVDRARTQLAAAADRAEEHEDEQLRGAARAYVAVLKAELEVATGRLRTAEAALTAARGAARAPVGVKREPTEAAEALAAALEPVEQGELGESALARLEALARGPEAQLSKKELELAALELKTASVGVEAARADLKQLTALREVGAVSPAEVAHAQRALAEAELRAERASLAAARARSASLPREQRARVALEPVAQAYREVRRLMLEQKRAEAREVAASAEGALAWAIERGAPATEQDHVRRSVAERRAQVELLGSLLAREGDEDEVGRLEEEESDASFEVARAEAALAEARARREEPGELPDMIAKARERLSRARAARASFDELAAEVRHHANQGDMPRAAGSMASLARRAAEAQHARCREARAALGRAERLLERGVIGKAERDAQATAVDQARALRELVDRELVSVWGGAPVTEPQEELDAEALDDARRMLKLAESDLASARAAPAGEPTRARRVAVAEATLDATRHEVAIVELRVAPATPGRARALLTLQREQAEDELRHALTLLEMSRATGVEAAIARDEAWVACARQTAERAAKALEAAGER